MDPGPNTTGAPQFTMGSHIDDVLRVQGTPSAISWYDASGTMTWRYGSSSVEIATPSKTVRQWTDRGNLRVEMHPGPNTTEAPDFSLGSHIDDVLRVQGTPSAISRNDASGTCTRLHGGSRTTCDKERWRSSLRSASTTSRGCGSNGFRRRQRAGSRHRGLFGGCRSSSGTRTRRWDTGLKRSSASKFSTGSRTYHGGWT